MNLNRPKQIQPSAFSLGPLLPAFGSDWAQLNPTLSQLSTLNHQLACDPLNKERRFLPLRLDDAPSETAIGSKFGIDATTWKTSL